MLLSLIKNLKQVGVSQIVSATLVVQGVAVQQSAVNDFSQQEAIVQELNQQAISQSQLSDETIGQQDQYWENIESVIEIAESQNFEEAPKISAVADVLEEMISDSSLGATSSPASGNLISGVSVTSPNPTSPTASKAPSVGPSSPAPSVAARGPAAASGVNGIAKPAEEAVPEKPEETISSSVPNNEVVVSEDNSVVEESSEEEVAEPTTPEPENEFDAYLEEVNLYRENVFVQEISDGDSISVEDSDSFEIQIEESEDIGSLRFTLTDSDSNQVVHGQNENLPPFQLGGGNGISIPAGSYSLLIELYDNDSFSGEAKAEKSLSFEIVNPVQSNPLDNSLALYRNGSFEAYINDGDTLYLNSSDDYNIQVESLSDFGSVNIDLDATNTNSTGGGQDNNLPYQLTNNPNGFNFETANYDLTVIAYPSDGGGDPPTQTLSINFDVIVQ